MGSVSPHTIMKAVGAVNGRVTEAVAAPQALILNLDGGERQVERGAVLVEAVAGGHHEGRDAEPHVADGVDDVGIRSVDKTALPKELAGSPEETAARPRIPLDTDRIPGGEYSGRKPRPCGQHGSFDPPSGCAQKQSREDERGSRSPSRQQDPGWSCRRWGFLV